MKASEGKLGRVFMLRLEDGDEPVSTIEKFASEKKIVAAQVFAVAESALTGILVPNAAGYPQLRLPAESADRKAWMNAEVIVQEVAGISLRRVVDALGKETFTRVLSTKTRVMEKPSPAPELAGPGTVPIYLFNAEFN